MGKTPPAAGYKRPPKNRCWKKGQSGNLKGRPRGHRNLAAVLTAVLAENVSVCANGEELEVTKLEAVTRQLVDRAMTGDARVTQLLFNEIHKNEAKAEREKPTAPAAELDRDVVEALFVRIRQTAAGTSETNG